MRIDGLVFLCDFFRFEVDVVVPLAFIGIFIEVFCGEIFQGVVELIVAVEIEGHVGGVIVIFIHIFEFRVLQVDDIRRISP